MTDAQKLSIVSDIMETERDSGEQFEGQEKSLVMVSALAGGFVVLLLVGIFAWHSWNQSRESKVVLHAGYTYTGPTPTPGAAQVNNAGKFTADANATWKTVKGQKYAYSFEAPENLNLVRLNETQFDIWAISWNNLSPDSNVLIGVDNLNRTPQLKEYINKPTISYVEDWWKQFGSLTGVSTITPFTNKNSIKGYRARYKSGANPAVTEDVFFEVPKHPELVIHLANGVLSSEVFDRILDTINWDASQKTTK